MTDDSVTIRLGKRIRTIRRDVGGQEVHEQVVQFTDDPTSNRGNPSYEITYTSGLPTQIDMTIGSTIYRKTLTWTDGNCTAITVWSEV